jgi:signal peptide peptidase SppA
MAIVNMKRRAQATRFVGAVPRSEDEGTPARHEPFMLTKHGVGIITVTGSLINRGAWVGSMSDQTSYEGIKHQLARAGADSRVKSVILDIETPGGEANGGVEVAAAVRALAAKKRVVAVANGMAVSAGYALASGASRIIAAPSAMTGSIGTVMLHLDLSKQLEKEGITPTLIFEGARKMDGNPTEPLSDTAHDTLRNEVRRYYELLIDTVSAGRGRRTPAKAARETEGRVFIGRDAIDARLIDDVGTFEEVLEDMSARASRARSSVATTTAKHTRPVMEIEDDTITASELQAAMTTARAEERTAAVNETIARFRTILADPRIKGKEAFAFKLACEAPTMAPDAVGSLCESVPAAEAPRIPTIAERVAATGADKITSTPAEDKKESLGWDKAVEEQNAKFRAQQARDRNGRARQ